MSDTKRQPWSRNELMLAMNLYCQLPFGKFHARNAEVIVLATRLGRTPSSVAMKLCNLASLDPAHQSRGVRGLSKAARGDRAIWDEFHADWNRLAAESELLKQGKPPEPPRKTSPTESTPDVPSSFHGATDAIRSTRVRLAQRFFRRTVLSSYESRCCVTGIAVRPFLIASHILPWSRFPNHRADPRNGLCLSRIHDAAFDRGLIAFDEERRLVLSQELREALTHAVLEASFRPFEGKAIQTPHRFQPSAEHLRMHRETVFRG